MGSVYLNLPQVPYEFPDHSWGLPYLPLSSLEVPQSLQISQRGSKQIPKFKWMEPQNLDSRLIALTDHSVMSVSGLSYFHLNVLLSPPLVTRCPEIETPVPASGEQGRLSPIWPLHYALPSPCHSLCSSCIGFVGHLKPAILVLPQGLCTCSIHSLDHSSSNLFEIWLTLSHLGCILNATPSERSSHTRTLGYYRSPLPTVLISAEMTPLPFACLSFVSLHVECKFYEDSGRSLCGNTGGSGLLVVQVLSIVVPL